MQTVNLGGIIEKGALCKRLNRKEAFCLIESINPNVLHDLGLAGLQNRRLRYGDFASYVVNLHINPTNICKTGCSFCHYAASKDEKHAYIMDESEIFNKVKKNNPTEVHIVGGLNDIWPYSRNLKLIRSLREFYPNLYIKAFTAVEIEYFAKTSGCDESFILDELKAAGINGITGGGAENFSDKLHKKYWKNKTTSFNWLRIHKIAHKKGISSNATMLFGFGDSWSERIEHLLLLRDTQEQTGGFSCFIPLPFQSGYKDSVGKNPSPLETLAVLAVSRLILNNIPHIKSYWPMMGIGPSTVGLSWGADDMDGTIVEEKIAHFAGATTPIGMTSEMMMNTIRLAGFVPKERDGSFNFKK